MENDDTKEDKKTQDSKRLDTIETDLADIFEVLEELALHNAMLEDFGKAVVGAMTKAGIEFTKPGDKFSQLAEEMWESRSQAVMNALREIRSKEIIS